MLVVRSPEQCVCTVLSSEVSVSGSLVVVDLVIVMLVIS